MQSRLQDNDIEMNSKHKKGKSVVSGRSIISLKNKICKYLASVFSIVCVNKLADIVNESNNTYRTTKLKPIGVKSGTYMN